MEAVAVAGVGAATAAVVGAVVIGATAGTAGNEGLPDQEAVFLSLGTPLQTFLKKSLRLLCACRLFVLLQHLT
jgi:hypothetical protein